MSGHPSKLPLIVSHKIILGKQLHTFVFRKPIVMNAMDNFSTCLFVNDFTQAKGMDY